MNENTHLHKAAAEGQQKDQEHGASRRGAKDTDMRTGDSHRTALLPEKTRERQRASSTCEGMSPSPPLLLVSPATSVFRPTHPVRIYSHIPP